MQLISFHLFFCCVFASAFEPEPELTLDALQAQTNQHLVYLQVGDRVVFDSVQMRHSNLSVYPNQLIFSIMDDEGQNISLTFAGKDISQRKPENLTFNEPGLFHGYSEKGDVFFIAFGKFAADRQPGQVKYDTSFPQNIMEGRLQVIIWTSEEFVFDFEGKLGKEADVHNPEGWIPFSGKVRVVNYQKYDM
jgi:hypothetical protein